MQVQPIQQLLQDAQWLGVRPEGWLTILAIFAGPILALLVQRLLDQLRENQKRKLLLFRAMMGSRGAPVSAVFVEALNQIDVEFSGKRASHTLVREAWKTLFDHLSDKNTFGTDTPAWNRKADDLRVELLYQMSKAVGYQFDKVDILRKIYVPGAHGELEDDQRLIRKGVVELLAGKRGLSTLTWLMPLKEPRPIQVIQAPADTPAVETHPPEQNQPLEQDPSQGRK